MTQRILFPTDFSDSAAKALPHALTLAGHFDADILLLHVRTLFLDDPEDPRFQFFDEGKYREYVRNEMALHQKALDSHSKVGSESILNVSAAAGILEHIQEKQIDMVVMGTHGRTALSRFFLGSVAEKVVRHARCPVLTISHQRENYRDRPHYQQILVAFDFSAYSSNAVLQAWKLALKYGAGLEVIYVVDQEVPPPFYRRWKLSVQHDLAAITQSMEESLRNMLGDQTLRKIKLHVEAGDGNGRADSEITRYAASQEADLLVMGTHGLSGVEHILLGSTTERVLRSAPCPVLTFHREDQV